MAGQSEPLFQHKQKTKQQETESFEKKATPYTSLFGDGRTLEHSLPLSLEKKSPRDTLTAATLPHLRESNPCCCKIAMAVEEE